MLSFCIDCLSKPCTIYNSRFKLFRTLKRAKNKRIWKFTKSYRNNKNKTETWMRSFLWQRQTRFFGSLKYNQVCVQTSISARNSSINTQNAPLISYLVIPLHILHCFPQLFKCRSITWVFFPTLHHDFISKFKDCHCNIRREFIVKLLLIYLLLITKMRKRSPKTHLQFAIHMSWLWHSVSFLNFFRNKSGVYVRVWRST